jgi:hypothetical protein
LPGQYFKKDVEYCVKSKTHGGIRRMKYLAIIGDDEDCYHATKTFTEAEDTKIKRFKTEGQFLEDLKRGHHLLVTAVICLPNYSEGDVKNLREKIEKIERVKFNINPNGITLTRFNNPS